MTRTENPVFSRALVDGPDRAYWRRAAEKTTAWRDAVAEADHDGSGAVSVQISDREALLTSYVPVTPDGVE